MKAITNSLPVGLAGLAILSMGCTSIRSTFYDTAHGVEVSGQSRYRGVPTTIEVSRWIKVEVHEQRYLPTDSVELLRVNANNQLYVTRDVKMNFVSKKELFTVDPKRPAAGSLKYAFGFGGADAEDTDKQNITNYEYDVEDKTIEKVSMAVTNMINRFNALKNTASAASKVASPPGDATSNMVEFNTTVAFEFFDLAQPDVEQKVQRFLELHVNQCHVPCATTR